MFPLLNESSPNHIQCCRYFCISLCCMCICTHSYLFYFAVFAILIGYMGGKDIYCSHTDIVQTFRSGPTAFTVISGNNQCCYLYLCIHNDLAHQTYIILCMYSRCAGRLICYGTRFLVSDSHNPHG